MPAVARGRRHTGIAKDAQVKAARCFAVDQICSTDVDHDSMEAVAAVLRSQILSDHASLVVQLGWLANAGMATLTVRTHWRKKKTHNTIATWMQRHAQAPLAWRWRVVTSEQTGHVSWEFRQDVANRLFQALAESMAGVPPILLPAPPAPPASPPPPAGPLPPPTAANSASESPID